MSIVFVPNVVYHITIATRKTNQSQEDIENERSRKKVI